MEGKPPGFGAEAGRLVELNMAPPAASVARAATLASAHEPAHAGCKHRSMISWCMRRAGEPRELGPGRLYDERDGLAEQALKPEPWRGVAEAEGRGSDAEHLLKAVTETLHEPGNKALS